MARPGISSTASGASLPAHTLDGFALSYSDLMRDIDFGGATLATAATAEDFPCRDEDKSDEEIDAETDALLSEIVRRANCYSDLLGALIAADDVLDDFAGAQTPEEMGDDPELKAIRLKARAALAKALGPSAQDTSDAEEGPGGPET